MGVVFDKLEFMRKLESGGDLTRPQAERPTDAFYDAGRPEPVLPSWRS